MVAMIAQYKPVTVILLSLFFAVLKIGAQGMELIGIPSQIYLIIQTVIIFCMAAERHHPARSPRRTSAAEPSAPPKNA